MKIAGVLLELPDGRFILHRRDEKAAASPGLLGFFGGKIEKGESPRQAALRELAEETTISPAGVVLEKLAYYEIPEPEPRITKPKIFNLFKAKINNTDFQVVEGIGLEVYSETEILSRSDLTPSVNHFFNNIRGAR